MKKRIAWIGLAMVMALLGFGWWHARMNGAGRVTKVTDVGSTALQPLAEAAVPGFLKDHSGVNITVQGGGSGTGLSQVAAGAVDIGSSDVFAAQQSGINPHELRDHLVAVTGIVPVVNPKLGVHDLTMNQLREIFSGQITNWKQVGGPNEKITVINRASGSGTRLAFEQVVMAGQPTIKAQEQDSNGTVKQIVANVPGAISYVATAYVNKQVAPVKLDGVSASYQNITSNRWKLWAYEHMYTRKEPTKMTRAFISYLQDPYVQNHLVKNARYVSIHDMQVTRNAQGQVTPVRSNR